MLYLLSSIIRATRYMALDKPIDCILEKDQLIFKSTGLLASLPVHLVNRRVLYGLAYLDTVLILVQHRAQACRRLLHLVGHALIRPDYQCRDYLTRLHYQLCDL